MCYQTGRLTVSIVSSFLNVSVFLFLTKVLLLGMLKDDLTWDKRDASDIKSTTALAEDQSLIPSTHIG